MSRRYTLPRQDGEIVVLALQMALAALKDYTAKHDSTAYEEWMILRMEALLKKLEEYDWEVKKCTGTSE